MNESSSQLPAEPITKKREPLSRVLPTNARSRYDILLLLLCSLLFQLHIFHPTKMFRDDSAFVYSRFYAAATSLTHNNEFPEWLPYGTFGIPSNASERATLTTISYVFLMIHRLVGFENISFLFKLSVCAEVFIFGFGLYQLAFRLRFSRFTSIVLAIVGMSSLHVSWALMFNQRSILLLPLFFYFMIGFIHKLQWVDLSLAILFFGLNLAGSGAYLAIMNSYFLAIFTLPFLLMLFKHKPDSKESFLLLLSTITTLVIIYLNYAMLSAFFLENTSLHGGRCTGGGLTDVGFLGGGTSRGFAYVLSSLLLGSYNIPSPNYYIGVGTLLLSIYGIILTWRTKLGAALLSTVIFGLWISCCGGFSLLCYHLLPGMGYIRFLPHIIGYIRIPLLIFSGFGIENLISQSSRISRISYAYIILTFILLLVVSDAFMHDFVFEGITNSWILSRPRTYLLYVLRCVVLVIVIAATIYAMRRLKVSEMKRSRIVMCAIAMYFMFDLGGYSLSSALSESENRMYSEHVGMYSRRRPWQYVDRIHYRPADAPIDSYINLRPNIFNEGLATHLLSDIFVGYYFFGSVPKALSEELNIAPLDRGFMFTYMGIHSKPEIQKALGFDHSKLQFVTSGSEPKADDIKDEPELGLSEILTGIPLGQEHVLDFGANHISVVIPENAEGGWLYYADSMHPGWMAMVDGNPRALHAGPLGMKTLYVQQGERKVEMRFSNPMMRLYRLIMTLGGCFLVMIVLLTLRGTRSQQGSDHVVNPSEEQPLGRSSDTGRVPGGK